MSKIISQGFVIMRGNSRLVPIPDITPEGVIVASIVSRNHQSGAWQAVLIPGIGIQFTLFGAAGKRIKIEYKVIKL